MDNVNEIYVYENWKSDTPSLIGTLYVVVVLGCLADKALIYGRIWSVR